MNRDGDDFFLVALVTAPSAETARSIADRLVGERLAACVNIVPGITSVYRWQGKINEDNEVLLIVKTRRGCQDRLETLVRSIHPYEVPEILFLSVAGGSDLPGLAGGGNPMRRRQCREGCEGGRKAAVRANSESNWDLTLMTHCVIICS